MSGGDDNAFGTDDKIHRPSHAGQQFAGDDPVGETTFLIGLKRAKHGGVNVSAEEQAEAHLADKERATKQRCDETPDCPDKVIIFLLRFGADAETAVFSLNNKAGLSGRKIELYDLCF